MVKFETVRHEELEFGRDNFIEVSLKTAKDEMKPEDPGVRFISVSRGYRATNGQRRYRMHFTIPPDRELIAFVRESLDRIAAEIPAA